MPTLTDDELAKKYGSDQPGSPASGALSEDELAQKYGNAAAREAMPAEKQAQANIRNIIQPVPPTRLESLMRPLPRTPGSDEEAIREGSGPGGEGLATIGTLGMPIEAFATRSLTPLYPLVRGAIGAYVGKHVGRDLGDLVGFPKAGETIGAFGGGAWGAAGGKVPTSKLSLLKGLLPEAAEAGEAEAAGSRLKPINTAPEPINTAPEEPFRLTSPAGETEPAIQERLRFPKEPETVHIEPERPEGGRLEPVGKARSPRGYFNPGRSEPVKLDAVVNQATGVKPLKPDVPLNEQLTKTTANEPAAIDPIKERYPDPKVRQMVRANGERIYEAAKHDPNLVAQLHDLTRVDLSRAAEKAGIDLGQRNITNSKFAGEGGITRQEIFNQLLEKHSPEEIVKLAKQPIGEPSRLEPIYRVHDTGADPNEIDVNKHAHATTDLEDARTRIMPFRNQGTPQTISTARGTPGVDYDLHPRENQPAWVKMRHRNLKWEPIK